MCAGSCISLKDASAAVAVECCLRSFLKAFCCDNYRDEAVLQELMTRFYPRGTRPQIIVSPFTDKLYNVHGRSVPSPSLFLFSSLNETLNVSGSFPGRHVTQTSGPCWT